jgi:hypothetical protein
MPLVAEEKADGTLVQYFPAVEGIPAPDSC